MRSVQRIWAEEILIVCFKYGVITWYMYDHGETIEQKGRTHLYLNLNDFVELLFRIIQA